MAWDSKESPWQWDTGAVLLQGHGSDPRYRAPARGWGSEACFTGHVCSQSGSVSSLSGLGTCVTSLSSASSNLHGALATGIGEQGDFAPPDQRRLPVVTTLKGNESFSFGCNGEDSGKVAQNRGQDNRKGVDDSNAGFLELGRRPSNHTQQQGKGSIQPERQGRVFLPAGGSAQDTKNGTAAQQTEEQNSSTATGSAGSGDSLIGLHLGKRAYFEDASGGAGTKAAQKPPPSNPAPTKKPRAAAGALHTPRCQVEGCKTDLTSAKDYHRRHKVCEMHSKAVKVIVANQEQRFCQQCSRFHVLAEFDEAKRSCRRRLAGHNERRRKPQPDALAINSRLPSVLQEWPSFFHHPRFSGMSSLWEDPGDFRLVPLKGAWPRTIKLEDQQTYDNIVQAPGMERQLFLTGLPPHTSDKLPLLLLQSPRRMMSVQDDTSSQRVYQYLPGSVGPVGNGLTLSSSPGTGVLSGFEAIPATQAVTRVTDSGRALSLLSALTRGSHAPDTVSLDLSTPTSITVDQFISESQTAAPQQLVQGGQQHQFDYTTGNLLSIASNCRNHSSAVSVPADGMTSMEKDQYAGLFLHGLNGVGSFESNPLFSTLQGNESRGAQDARQTIDLMRNSSESQSACPQGSSVGFELGSSTYGDLQYSYEPSFFDSQQRM